MRNDILAAAAALALALGAAPAFAAAHGGGQQRDGGQREQANHSDNVDDQCANILANPAGYPASDVRYCRERY